jgi:hypothetical protein
MNSISSQTPSLADTLQSLSSQTQPSNVQDSSVDSDGDTDGSTAADSSGADVLCLSAGSNSSLTDSLAEIESQNRSSSLADSSAALAATRAASAYASSQPGAAYASQSASTPDSVLSLLTGE